MVVIDATMLVLLVNPNARGPTDGSGKPVPYARERVEHLITQLEAGRVRIIIPAPALAEVLVRLGPNKTHDTVELLGRMAVFSIEPFDQLAAIELAEMLRGESAQNRKKARAGGPETHAKLKFDRQIVAIARVRTAKIIYSDDEDIGTLGKQAGIRVLGVKDLPLPPEKEQIDLIPHEALPSKSNNADSN